MPILGIDWGTSNRRAYLMDADGKLIRRHADEYGILAVAGAFEKSLADLLLKLELEQADVLMSGMIGSRNGWREVPYLPVDLPLLQLPQTLVEIDTSLANVRCRIVPGYRYNDVHGTPDVLRGEETQALGALALSASNGWFVLPGTHSKWVRIDGGTITEFVTFMTGELYDLLSHHGTLANLMQEKASVPTAFEAGMKAAALQSSFTHAAFNCRALVVTGAMPAAHASSYLSGLLIGAELQEIRLRTNDQTSLMVQLIGTPALAAHYADALTFFGMTAVVWPPDDVYLAALRMLAGIH